MMRTLTRVSVAGMLVFGALALAPSASAAEPGEQITSYDISVTVAPNGTAEVTERIGYDFGTGQRHGLTRTLPGRTLVGQPTVTSPDGASTMTTITGNTIRIGDPDTTVTGAHTYVLNYEVAAVVTPSTAYATTLSWSVVDGSWDVPITAVTETLTVPGTATLESCLAGGIVCTDSVQVSGQVLHINRTNVTPHQTVAVIATVPSAAFAQTTPIASYTYPTSSYNSASSSDSSSRSSSSAVGWVLGLGGVVVVIALIAKAAGGSGGSRRSNGYYDNGSSSYNGYYNSGSSSSSYTDSGSSSSYTDSGSSSSGSSDSGSSSSSCGSGSW
ncbi:hypothetical protein GCM10029964_079430 [Kibdelosporangium lantanae]